MSYVGQGQTLRPLPRIRAIGVILGGELPAERPEVMNERNPMEEDTMMAGTNALSSIILGATLAVAMGTIPVSAKECYAPDARSQERAFSRAVVTEGGKTVWLGGQTGSPNLDFEGQAREAFSELDKSIKAVGGSGLKDMVTMTVFIADVRLGDRLTEICKEIFKECFPGKRIDYRQRFRAPRHID